MSKQLMVNAHDAIHWFVDEQCSRVIAESGIPSDRYHLGKIILQGLKDAPELVHQIDGGTDEYETNASVLERTVRCAIAFRKLGLALDDVVTIMAPNHNDAVVPFYAALYLGIIVAPVDVNLGVLELESTFTITKPKLILCQREMTSRVVDALEKSKVEATIITFDKCEDFQQFHQLLKTNVHDDDVKNFKTNDFDAETATALIASTSGTTGVPKGATLTHKNLLVSIAYNWLGFNQFPTPTRLALGLSPLQWLSAVFNIIYSPILKFTRLQTSKPVSLEHIYFLINKYKPTSFLATPALMAGLVSRGAGICDFSCLEDLGLGGSIVPEPVVNLIKKAMPSVNIRIGYGLTEASGGSVFYDPFPPKNSLGRPVGCLNYRLVDIETQKDITEPNVPGELWLKGPTTFKGYYKNSAATAEVYAEGDWLKTGDVLYRDKNWYFYFVDRLKQMLKYKNYQISPMELEGVIRQHPGVLDVAVTGVPDPECGDLPVACVVRKPDANVTAQEVKDLVKATLAEFKQLRGGVAFVDQLPMTMTAKIDRRKLKEMALSLDKK